MASRLAQPIALSLHPTLARRQIRRFLAELNWPGDVDGVVLAIHEALVNAQRHAGGARRAEASVEGSTLVVHVWDCGPGFDPADYLGAPPEPTAERGRGLWLMNRVATSCEVQRAGGRGLLVLRFEY